MQSLVFALVCHFLRSAHQVYRVPRRAVVAESVLGVSQLVPYSSVQPGRQDGGKQLAHRTKQ
eukprot:15464969-Alexandrium_andersonii.AAC.1